ncbi:MAG: hypothetical protein R3B13_33375 [Polyangiaceae bacterium]
MSLVHEYAFGQVCGLDVNNLHCIGSRAVHVGKFDHTNGESHVYERRGQAGATELPTPGLFASIWRSRQGNVYLAHRDGAFFTRQPNGTWDRCMVRASLLGIWGLDDDHVYGWGLAGDEPVMFQKAADGTWPPMSAPEKLVFGMSGDRPDRLIAVGLNGSISIWDGGTWRAQSSPVSAALSSVHWVSEDEIYVTGPSAKFVLEGSIHGWSRRGPFPYPLHCVARFAGKLWVGCGLSGLHVLPDGADRLELVKPNIQVTFFDPRGNLVMSGTEMIVETADGDSFAGVGIAAYKELADRLPPSW